jgi:tungstate transport system ATP-binding protein
VADAPILPLEARGLSVAFGATTVLHAIDLSLDAGTRTVILGANGAGKSVLLRALHGLIPLSCGEIRWNGAAARPAAQAMVFQRPVMLRRSALANITYALAVNGVARARRNALASVALERVGLGPLAERPARVLSGGEQQRLALARAWALRPKILFLDEPTASLDPAAMREVERVIGEIHATGTKIVMTTHNLGQARRIADEIVFLHGGRLVERSPAELFFSQPRSSEAAVFLEGELPWAPHSRAS